MAVAHHFCLQHSDKMKKLDTFKIYSETMMPSVDFITSMLEHYRVVCHLCNSKIRQITLKPILLPYIACISMCFNNMAHLNLDIDGDIVKLEVHTKEQKP